MAPSRNSAPRLPLLCLGFVISGVVTVLPGPLLPLLAAKWGLRDVQSGAFFAAEFFASTLGAILSPLRIRRNLPAGFALMAAGLLLLMFAAQTAPAAFGNALALAGFTLIGFGIGLSVTATNLTVGSASGQRARRLSIVNLWWGIGAVACPGLIAAAERVGHLRLLLLLVALAAAAIFLALSPLLRSPDTAPAPRPPVSSDAAVLAFFAVLLFLYVGVENAVCGWIATYAHRFSGMTLEHASMFVSVFWIALLAGRALGSLALRYLPERAVLLPSAALALAAVALLVVPQSPPALLAVVAAAGLGFGPVFPLGVSRLLARVADHRNTGWVFATCASGGAALPWLTGLVSTRSGSLRTGFAVPVFAMALILLLILLENVILHEPVPAKALRQSA